MQKAGESRQWSSGAVEKPSGEHRQQGQTVTGTNEREGPGQGTYKKNGTQYNARYDEAFGNHWAMLTPERQQEIRKAIKDSS